MNKLELVVRPNNPTDKLAVIPIDCPVYVGRQRAQEEPLNTTLPPPPDNNLKAELRRIGLAPDESAGRIAVANLLQASISRLHLFVAPLEDGRFRLRNLSKSHPIFMERPQRELKPDQEIVLANDEVLWLGEKAGPDGAILQPRQPLLRLIVQRPADDLDVLPEQTLAPGGKLAASPPPAAITPALAPDNRNRDRENFLAWIDQNMDVFQSATHPEQLYQGAADAVMSMIRLDAGQIFLLGPDGTWQSLASAPAGVPPRPPRERVLARMLADGHTVFVSEQALSASRSMLGLEIVAAAPIKDRDGKVIGAVYGERRKQGALPRTITNEEALLLQLIARAVAAALNRLRAEEGSRRELTRLTMYMSDQQAQAVIHSPDWRTGRPMNVSVLFCDVVGSTEILAARTALSAEALRWSGEVLEMLTRCVRDSGGTLIDYTGDGLFALWGAPIAVPDHADRACSAAVAMADGLRDVNALWEPKIRQRTDLRLGLNSGPVTVGNIGTTTFEKFGAYGEDVNLGKRMETAAKSLQARILMHESAGRALATTGKYAIRRLRTIRVKGVVRPFDVYEVSPNFVIGRDKWDEQERRRWRDQYEKALGLFESGKEDNVREAGGLLARWREDHRWDRPALVLLAHAVTALAEYRLGEELKVLDLS